MQLDASIPFTDLCSFGRKLIDALQLEPTDTLGRWMAHFLAERLVDAERATGPEKECLEREVFDLVLQLWKHRGGWPGRRRPFQETDDLADRLRTFIDRTRPWYFGPDTVDSNHSPGDWIDKARALDRTARDLIGWCITHAVAETSQADAAWVDDSVARQLDDGGNVRLAKVLFTDVSVLFDGDTPQRRSQELKRMRDRIDVLLEVANDIRQEINIEIVATEQRAKVKSDAPEGSQVS